MESSISLEETNKIRVKLGLKPLVDDAAPADSADKQAEDNYVTARAREAKEHDAKKITDQIAKVRNRRDLNASLKGQTLGDADGDDDTLKWLKKSKKREKELAKKRREELENMDKVFQGEDYSERDLVGLKVSHDFGEMDEGDARILTLKDSRILDNEEDELQNVEMAEEERNKKNHELKTKKREYTGYDDDEFLPGNEGQKRAVLAKYDEDIEGTQETGFRLGASTAAHAIHRAEQQKVHEAATVNTSLLSIDYAKNLETYDYLREGDAGFKKPKTKKKRPSRRMAEEEDPEVDAMQVDEKPTQRVRDLDSNFVDDDDLQAALARARKAKIHKRKKLTPEEMAEKIAAEQEEDSKEVINVDDGLTFDDTSEFVRAINYTPVVVKAESAPEAASVPPPVVLKSEPQEISLNGEDVAMDEVEIGDFDMKDEEDEEAILNAIEAAIKLTEAEEAAGDVAVDGVGGTSTQENFGTGMASTLNILRQQGILATPGADAAEREKTQLQRDLWLANQRRTMAQRELDKMASRGSNKDQGQREYENKMREQNEARQNLEAYKNYKPDVNIVYYDEFGRALTPKEAWKALSHRFHGKGSGKMKTEKRLKKIAEEKRKEAMVSGDTPLSMNAAFQQRQEKAGQAHFVLSVGNRGAVPQAEEFLDAQPLTKTGGKTEKAKNKKNKQASSSKSTLDNDTGFMTLPAPTSNFNSPLEGSPAPTRAGFSRIGSAVESGVSSNGGTPGPSGERSKVAFGFAATKRKAGDDAMDSPPPKRRG